MKLFRIPECFARVPVRPCVLSSIPLDRSIRPPTRLLSEAPTLIEAAPEVLTSPANLLNPLPRGSSRLVTSLVSRLPNLPAPRAATLVVVIPNRLCTRLTLPPRRLVIPLSVLPRRVDTPLVHLLRSRSPTRRVVPLPLILTSSFPRSLILLPPLVRLALRVDSFPNSTK